MPKIIRDTAGMVIKCAYCSHKGINVSTATDGGPEYTSDNCSYTWTMGKKGY